MQNPEIELRKSILAALSGTSAMTAFSYILSDIRHKNFKEPYLLSILIRRLALSPSRKASKTQAWILHYAVGCLFVAVYSKIWKHKTLSPGWKSGFLLGALTSIPAVAIWDLVLRLHPDPPKTDRKEFYMQLVIAHMIFGAVSGATYKKL